jgi:cytochrome c
MKKIVFLILAFSVAAFAAIDLNKCTSCHGQNFEKVALGTSKIVADMTNEDAVNALLGYKNGSYGGRMKKVMKMQIDSYSNEEIKAISIGKATIVKKSNTKTKTQKSSNDSHLVFYEFKKSAYKDVDKCWVVDYENEKSNSVDCKILDERSKIDRHPSQPGMPSFVFRDLFIE